MALVTVFGGTGFLGRRIVERLLHGGAMVRVAARQTRRIDLGTDSERAGPTTFVAADVRDEDGVAAAIAGAPDSSLCTGAMNLYPRLASVSTKRGLAAESPKASRILLMAVFSE